MSYIGQKLAKNPIRVGKERLYDILRSPIVTEKSTLVSQNGAYTFSVDLNASKPEIKQAVEEVFKVKVEKVNTLRVKGKKTPRRFKGIAGKRPDKKKAVVRLVAGQNIDVAAGV